MADLVPLPRSEREPLIDVLRALALCIVLVDNTMISFSGSVMLPKTSPDYFLGESAAGMVFRLLVGDRSMTVMALVFGLGFSIQLSRGSQRDVTRMYLRRLAVMFAFGVIHVVALWHGDILWVYALCGLLLLPCRNISTRSLVIAAIVLTLVPRVLTSIPAIGAVAVVSEAAEQKADAAVLAAMHGRDYAHVVAAHVRLALVHHGRNLLWILPWIGGRFIFGFIAGRLRLFENHGTDLLPLFRKLAIGGMVLWGINIVVRIAVMGREMGLPLKLLVRFLGQVGIMASVAVGVALVVFAMQGARGRRWLSVLEPVGQMPLTTYLSQTVISTFLFYGWGLGLVRHVQGVKSGLVGFAVFGVQIALARWWLRRYELGPMEWLWRTLAYGQRQPMRRESEPELALRTIR